MDKALPACRLLRGTLTVCVALTVIRHAARAADSAPSGVPVPAFYLSFDNDVKAKRTDGGPVAPVEKRGVALAPGLAGRAARLSSGKPAGPPPLLAFDAGRLFRSTSGTLMFWVKPAWAGHIADLAHFPWYHFFRGDGPDGKRRFWLFMWNWLRCDLRKAAAGTGPGKTDPKKPKDISLAQHIRDAWFPGDWHHIAVSWNDHGWCKLIVDGLPYEQFQRKSQIEARADLSEIQRFYVGSVPGAGGSLQPATGLIDEFKVFQHALGDAAVMAEVRRFQPFDLVVDRRFIRAETPEHLDLDLYPGGRMLSPRVGALVPTPIPATVTLTLVDAHPPHTVRSSQRFPLRLTEHRRLVLPVRPVPAGNYRFRVTIEYRGTQVQRTYAVLAFKQRPAPPASTTDLDLKPASVDIDCTGDDFGFISDAPTRVRTDAPAGPYCEAGEHKGDRFSYEIPFEHTDGPPVVLEVTWPDDRPRSMGLYMYRPAAKHAQSRDRLEGGIQSGDEFPVSGGMQTTRYLFYPYADRYLFEARTLVSGYPAAVARVRVLPVRGRLPKLAIATPGRARHRVLGHLDEDQSFEILLNDSPRAKRGLHYAVNTLERLLDIMDYTGQDVMAYPMLRYDFVYYDLPGQPANTDGFRAAGWPSLFLDMFAARGKQLIAECNLYTLPEAVRDTDAIPERQHNGYFLKDRYGRIPDTRRRPLCNPAHPEVRRQLLGHIREVLTRFGRDPGFGGLDIWVGGRRPWGFVSLDYGYGDFTVRRFERDTGKHVPGKDGDPGRFQERYAWLTGPGRSAWLEWRARQTTSLFREAGRRVAEFAPGRPFRISFQLTPGPNSPGWRDLPDDRTVDFARCFYEQDGFDLSALNQLPGVRLVPLREPSMDRWLKHWHDGGENIAEELMMDPAKFAPFKNPRSNACSSYMRYFESFRPSLKNDRFKGYFQNADPKPFGRWFLHEFAAAITGLDPDCILIGAQPLGTAGRDGVVREFTRAWCALPQGAYRDVPGSSDPVVFRQFEMKDGRYLYAVSRTWQPLTVDLSVRGADAAFTDLSTGESVRAVGGRLAVALAPFQLRSFRANAGVRTERATVRLPGSLRAWYANRVRQTAEQVAELRKAGLPVDAEDKQLREMQRLLEVGHVAEVHRLLFSRRIRRIPELLAMNRKGWLSEQAAMVRQSRFAVNCGDTHFRRLAGTLFFPDRRFTPGALYGYVGSCKTVGRPVPNPLGGIDDQSLRWLFATEAYDVAGYRFRVKPGSYVVRLYLKVGYRPGAKPGNFVLNVDIEGKHVLDKLDLFTAAAGRFNHAVVREFRNVPVRNGTLDIAFSVPPEISSTARLCDGIEIIPETVGPGK